MTILSISDKKFVNQIYEQTRFPHKYVSVITVFIQLHVYNIYLLLFDLERSNDFYKVALDWQLHDLCLKFNLLNWFKIILA